MPQNERAGAQMTDVKSIKIVVDGSSRKAISPLLFGIFFEDLNYAADGGLYAEMVQNRSFEYSAADNLDWNFLTSWEVLGRAGAVHVAAETESPIHPNNPHYLALQVDATAGEAGIRNRGFGGMVIEEGAIYDFSCFVRTLAGAFASLRVEVRSRLGDVLAAADLGGAQGEWNKLSAELVATANDPFATLSVIAQGAGTLAIDMVSLFPRATYMNRANGLRANLAQTIAELRPRFMRFPGGCLVHGDGLGNMYRWKDTLGAIETRRGQFNLWGYHQSVGLGYFEYFQFCEDIGAKPLPVLPAAVCCPNTDARWTGGWEEGQQALPDEAMDDYIQEVLDLIEWANGSPESPWGALRAAAGHPEPFGLEYIGIGNEDRITEVFKDRFARIYHAVRAAHPEITLIGTVGPRPEGEDYELGWEFARALDLDMVDEHEYRSPEWHWENLARYDTYDREGPKVYLGEYAAHDLGRRNTWRSALSEAAWMTALERNGDVVSMASYAPLLGKRDRMQWRPDLIYFDNRSVVPSLNYWVQQLFSHNAGEEVIGLTIDAETNDEGRPMVAASCVRDGNGDVVLKMVSRLDIAAEMSIDLSALSLQHAQVGVAIMWAEVDAENDFKNPMTAQMESSVHAGAATVVVQLPAQSIGVFRVSAGVDVIQKIE